MEQRVAAGLLIVKLLGCLAALGVQLGTSGLHAEIGWRWRRARGKSVVASRRPGDVADRQAGGEPRVLRKVLTPHRNETLHRADRGGRVLVVYGLTSDRRIPVSPHVAAERLDLSAVPQWKLHAVKAAIIALSAALAAPLGCARSGPVRPSQRATLVIRPEINGIIVSEREQLSAWLVGEGPDQEVIVDWTTDDSSILGVDHQGLVTAERFGTATVLASRDALLINDN